MNGWTAAWLLARKDLRVYFRDRSGVALGFGLPVILVLAFGFVYQMTFGNQGGGMSRTTLWVADEDGTAASAAFVERLRDADMLAVRPRDADDPIDAAKARRMVEDGEAHHALVVRAGFADAMAEPRFPDLEMIRDPGRTLEAQMVSIGLMQAFFSSGSAELTPLLTARALDAAGLPSAWSERMLAVSRTFSSTVESMFVEADAEGLLDDGAAADGADAAGSGGGLDLSSIFSNLVPVEHVDVTPPERPKQLTYMLAHNISGISVMMLMFGLVACGILLLQERDEGTLKRLLLAAVPRSSILGGKFLFTAIVGAGQLAVMFLVGGLVFRVNLLRDPVTLLVVSAALLFAVTSFGILIASLARTMKQAEGMSTLVILLMSAVGGAWFPLQMFSLPAAGEIVCRCTLTWWAMSAFQGMLWHGKTMADAGMLRDVSVLVAFGVVASLIAWRVFRRRFVEA
ncbi:MAG: ABC transporter permease [Planctomycetota bacterium JB042]